MKAYLMSPAFWIAVIIVALVVNFVWAKVGGGKGKLV
jgi:hypothetical protein